MTFSEPTKPIQLHPDAGTQPRRSTLSIVLWIIQVLLALLFIFSGAMKLVMPLEKLAGPPGSVVLPEAFIRFIGVAELLGGIGLLLPALLRIKPGLTPLAAAGLVIIMIGAVAVTLMGPMGAGMAVVPAVTGLLAGFVAYGRWRLAPIRPRS
jgi:uncharacterized membrane protein YphA (DoxX/SURF4 family)